MNKTNIEGCDYTWNPITGCTRISPGCKNCYAHGIANRFNGGDFSIKFHPERLGQPLDVKQPSKIFVGSMTDMFHNEVRIDWFRKVMEVVRTTKQHTFIVLTKRPENMSEEIMLAYQAAIKDGCYDNLWLGVSVCTRTDVDGLRHLKMIPAKVKFISVEPMLERISLGDYLSWLDWVICGPENGKGARPMKEEWAEELSIDCKDYDIPFFMKGELANKYGQQFPGEETK